MLKSLPVLSRWTLSWLTVGMLAPLVTVLYAMYGNQSGSKAVDSEDQGHLQMSERFSPIKQQVDVRWVCVAVLESEKMPLQEPWQFRTMPPADLFAVSDVTRAGDKVIALQLESDSIQPFDH